MKGIAPIKNPIILEIRMKPQPEKKSALGNILKFVLVIFVLLFVISILFVPAGADCIARVKITGDIVYDSPEALFGGAQANTPEEVNSLLKEADGSFRVKAILIQVNSGGGSAVASKEIFDEVKLLEKPTLIYMTEIAASGGYYISAAGDYIIAHPNSLTGSIGARATLLNYEGLFEKLGLREESIKSGELKDIGAGYRNLTDEERQILEGLITETFQIFRDDVQEARKGKLNYALFNQALDARILSAAQAKRIGLIDELGGMRRVLIKANEMAGNNATSEEELLPICDFGRTRGFSLFTDLSASMGRGFAEGFIEGIKEDEVGVKYG